MNTISELIKRVFHFGPIATLGLVKTITLSTIYCSLMWWPPSKTFGGLISLTSFLCSSGLVMYNFFSAMTIGPGYLPYKWTPKSAEDCKKLQFCTPCDGYKAPRAHHCRKCGRCTMKMDHHCPWINNCVGHRNQAHFLYFLLFAVVGCAQASVILTCSMYRALYRIHYLYSHQDVPIVYLGVYGIIWVLFSVGCAIGVTLGVGVLLYYQVKILLKNQTGIEDWIIEKAQHRRSFLHDAVPFFNPYDLGWKKNCKLVINFSCEPLGDGIYWPVRSGCDQYTLTMEQLAQKDDKKKRSREYIAVEDYSGSWFPLSKGLKTCCHPPFSDESRMRLYKNEKVVVTRWKRYWLYGALQANSRTLAEARAKVAKPKGWFPRRCVVEVLNSQEDYDVHFDEDLISSTHTKKD